MFDDRIVEEYREWKDANNQTFNWWSYLNMKADLDIALAFSKLYCPDIKIIDDCFFLADRYDEKNYLDWKCEFGEDKSAIEKMVNLYSLEDIFHINTTNSEYYEEKINALGKILQYFWSLSFAARFPDRKVKILISQEYEDETFISVYQERE